MRDSLPFPQPDPLNAYLEQQDPASYSSSSSSPNAKLSPAEFAANVQSQHPIPGDLSQWLQLPGGNFRPAGPTLSKLAPGTYIARHDNSGVYFEQLAVITDSLIVLDDTASSRVVSGIRTFWINRDAYSRYNLIYKRGILLWGPAGSGKTGTLMLLSQELIAMGGLVVMVANPSLTGLALAQLRRIEPSRPLICIFEDIDELIREHGEHTVLALLDGEYQIGNVVNIATTNYPERLGPRIINRPSRFDERIFIDTPTAAARERYIRHLTKIDPLEDHILACWIQDSAGFSIAHVREMVIATMCLGHRYEEVITRLRGMQKQVKPLTEFETAGRGF